tara:strand:+ start:329 stop:730 length:402 start_codon:yes stop_codon:yes gene_type:complete
MTKTPGAPHSSTKPHINIHPTLSLINKSFKSTKQVFQINKKSSIFHQMPTPHIPHGIKSPRPIELSWDSSSSDKDEIDQELDLQALLAIQPNDLNQEHRPYLFPISSFDQNQLNYQPKTVELLTLDDCLNLIR